MKFLFTGNYLPDYNRTAIISTGLKKLGHEVVAFPFEKKSREVRARLLELAATVDVVFLPSFTQREVGFVRKVLPSVKLVYDPLISHYMTKVLDYKLASRFSLGALRSFYRDKWSQAAADLVFTDTEAHRLYFHREFGTPLEKMVVLYIGNNFDEFMPAEGVPQGNTRKFRVGFYGGFIPLQGVMKILAAAKLLKDHQDIEFDMVGNGFEYKKALAFIAYNQLSNVISPGWVNYKELPARLKEFDIALGIFGDGPKTDLVIPNKVYHYAGSGLPIVTKNTSAIRELFKDGENIMLTEGTPEAIVTAILRLKNDASLRERLGRSAFQTINSGYNEVKVAESLWQRLTYVLPKGPMHTYRKLFREILKFRGQFFTSMFFGVLWSLSLAQVAFHAKPLFDKLTKNPEAMVAGIDFHDQVVGEVLVIVGFYLFALFTRYWHMYLNAYTADCVSVALRRKLNNKFLRLDLSYHNKLDSGSGTLLSRLLNDVGQVENGIGIFADFFREPVLLIVLLVNLFLLDYKLTCVLMVSLPIVAFVMRRISRSLRKYSGRALGELEAMTSVVKEGLDGTRVIQSFNLQSELARRFDVVAAKYLDARKKLQSRTELSGPMSETIAVVLLGVMIMYMALRISHGDATIGNLISYFASIVMLNQPIKKLQDSYPKFQRTVASADRIFDILENGTEIVEAPGAVTFPSGWQKIEYKNVTFAYDKVPVLKNFSLTINRGEVVAFVGESGSGKTTVVNLLERFFEPTSGEILIDGIPLYKLKVHDLRQNVGLVTQDVFLFNDSIEYNIHSGDFTKPPPSVESSARSSNAHNFISAKPASYKTRVGDRGGMLSGGERQRVSIARAFVKDAPILILDEATSALDSASEIEVQKGLESLMAGRTVLVIAHRLSTVMNAHKIIVMKNGENC